MDKVALITGISGQDGSLIADFLLTMKYKVYGIVRRNASGSLWRLDRLGITNRVTLLDADLTEYGSIFNVIKQVQPDEIYNLGAMSFVKSSFEVPSYTIQTNTLGFLYILESVRNLGLINKTRIYQASTSEMFGKVQEMPQTERTPFYPRSPYGIAKLASYWLGINYRESYNMFVSNGILFNHESDLRGSEFVSKKITEYVARYINLMVNKPLELGNMESKRDWGYAGDYVVAMHKMLQAEKPNDFVVATGETHTVKEFVDLAFNEVGVNLKWFGSGINTIAKNPSGNIVVTVNPKYYRPAEVDVLLGNANKALELLNWKPKTSFKELVHLMVSEDLKYVR